MIVGNVRMIRSPREMGQALLMEGYLIRLKIYMVMMLTLG
jgi:hypothetical protein